LALAAAPVQGIIRADENGTKIASTGFCKKSSKEFLLILTARVVIDPGRFLLRAAEVSGNFNGVLETPAAPCEL
jgi:hypothetical protein